jgi:hypothetical protein
VLSSIGTYEEDAKIIGYHPKKYLAKSDSEYYSLANQPSILMATH